MLLCVLRELVHTSSSRSGLGRSLANLVERKRLLMIDRCTIVNLQIGMADSMITSSVVDLERSVGNRSRF